MVRVAKVTFLPIGAVMLVGRPVILSKPRIINTVPPCGGAGGTASGAVTGATACAGGSGIAIFGAPAVCAQAAARPAGNSASIGIQSLTGPRPDPAPVWALRIWGPAAGW